MWLINTATYELEPFTGSKNIPSYAILSHTWGKDKDEVSFKEMVRGVESSPTANREGFKKIKMTCRLARKEHHLDYAWPKSQRFQDCKWFSRGWTLQELLAPRDILFFDASWTCRGTKQTLRVEISANSRIDVDVLMGTRSLEDIPIAVRMSWASTRETRREEDEAYCLLGIFDVNMPMLYGEGQKAFFRLQEEIIKKSADMSIFAWMALEVNPPLYTGLLARSPADFRHSGVATICDYGHFDPAPFSINNRGVSLQTILYRKTTTGLHIMPVNCKLEGEKAPKYDPHSSRHGPHGIYLRQVGRLDFVRAFPSRIVNAISNDSTTRFQVATQLSTEQALFIDQHVTFIRSPCDFIGDFYLSSKAVHPIGCYDPSQRIIYAGHTGTFLGYFHFEPEWTKEFDTFYFIFRFDRSRGKDPWRYALLSGRHWTHKQPYRAHYASYSRSFFAPGKEMSLRLPRVDDESKAKKVVLTIVPPESREDRTPWSRTVEFAVMDE
ncbi:hypothetical protein IFR05_008236 [Cadophora sp. M221]|nr:hypothetical protein IFR05_008236 [Cadophora sp. M221]